MGALRGALLLNFEIMGNYLNKEGVTTLVQGLRGKFGAVDDIVAAAVSGRDVKPCRGVNVTNVQLQCSANPDYTAWNDATRQFVEYQGGKFYNCNTKGYTTNDVFKDERGRVCMVLNGKWTVVSRDNVGSLPVAHPPLASASEVGGVLLGFPQQGRKYPVQVDGFLKSAFVEVPWTDTNTTYGKATASADGLMSASDFNKLGAYPTWGSFPKASNLQYGLVKTGHAFSGSLDYPVKVDANGNIFALCYRELSASEATFDNVRALTQQGFVVRVTLMACTDAIDAGAVDKTCKYTGTLQMMWTSGNRAALLMAGTVYKADGTTVKRALRGYAGTAVDATSKNAPSGGKGGLCVKYVSYWENE